MSKNEIKKSTALIGIMFFGALWGLVEAFLGDALYTAGLPFSSVILAVIAFGILALARVFLRITGAATLIAASAMLYKFLNVPFFPCHLVGILMLGVGFDLAFAGAGRKFRWLRAAGAAWIGYALFAVLMAFVLAREPWLSGGLDKVVRHIAISGSLAAVGAALVVPLCWRTGERLREMLGTDVSFNALEARPPGWRAGPGVLTLATAGAWAFGLAGFFRSVL